jgi:hypothetical protein
VAETGELLARLKRFCFPGGEEQGHGVRAMRNVQRGEFRSAPNARWIPFSAEETVDATRSSFCWEARFAGGSLKVTDAYGEGHGRLVMSLGGLVSLKRFSGPEVDRGELQRYLSYAILCPPMLLNHSSLEFLPVSETTLRVRDRADPMGAWVDLEIEPDGRPAVCRAERPRMLGKKTFPTPWCAAATEVQGYEGMRVGKRIEAAWDLPEGKFTYFRAEVISLAIINASAPSL